MVIPPSKPCSVRRWCMTAAETVGSISSRRAISSLKGSSLLERVKRARVSVGLSRYLCTLCRAIPRVRAILRTDRPLWAKRCISKMVRLSIIVSSQRIADQPANRRRIGLYHLWGTLEQCLRRPHRGRRPSEDFEEVAIKGNEILLDEGVTGHEVVIQGKL